MAVRRESRREHNPVKASRRETKRRAAELAPPEERDHEGNARAGSSRDALAIDTGELKLPDGLLADGEERAEGSFRLEPVVLFILACALAYIALIIYLISTGQE